MQVDDKEILVVLPYKQAGSQGNELYLTLNLWRKFCTFKYHFVVIGEFDTKLSEKFPWVEFIYSKIRDKVEGQYNQHLDVAAKFMEVMDKYDEQYSGFIWIADDNYAVKPFKLSDITQVHYHSLSFVGEKNTPTNFWRHDKWKTRQLLDELGLSCVNYTTHYPCWFDMDNLRELIKKHNLLNESYVLEDIYFNYYDHDTPISDTEIRLGIWNHDIYRNDFKKALRNSKIKFMCNSVEGWSKELEEGLKKLL